MAKRIKLTERQIKLIQDIESLGNTRKIKITESQYERLFKNNKKQLEEDGSIAVEFLTFASEVIVFLKEMMTDPSQAGLSPFWVKIGLTRGELLSSLVDLGIIAGTGYGGVEGTKKIFKIKKKGLIRALKRLYNEFSETPRYDIETGSVINKGETTEGLGDDIENEYDMLESGYPDGAQDDPFAPYNQEDNGLPSPSSEYFKMVDEVFDGNKHNLLFITDDESQFVVIYSDRSSEFEEFCSGHINVDCVLNKINYLAERDELEIGECGYDCGSHIIHDLTQEMKDYIMEYHANDETIKQKLMQMFSLGETTMAAGSSGAFEGPLSSEGPIKKTIHPSDELDETTMSGDSTGAYVTPKIWAKNPKLSRFSKDPMYPEGEIVSENGESFKRYVLNLGEVYIIAKDDADASKQSKELIKLINERFPEADANAESLHQKAGSVGDKPREVKSDESIYEAVAQKTGKTIAEVKEIIKNNINKG
jgi:hypothetical protein